MNKLYLCLAYWLLRRVVVRFTKNTWLTASETTHVLFSIVAFDVRAGTVSRPRPSWSVSPEGSEGNTIFANRGTWLDETIILHRDKRDGAL